jgi:spermidine synthase
MIWYLFIFLSGASSTAVEVTGLRLLVSLWGSSLPIWGSIIAAVLGGLAIGYRVGGQLASRNSAPSQVAKIAMLASALFVCLPPFINIAQHILRSATITQNTLLILISLAISLLTLLLPSIFFGMVSPLSVQIETNRTGNPAGSASGLISMLNTSGSIVGLLLPSFITIPLFGVKYTIWAFALSLLCVSIIISKRIQPKLMLPSVFVLLALNWLLPQASSAAVIHSQHTRHQKVTVHENNGIRQLVYDGGYAVQSLYTPELYTKGYWDYVAALPLLFTKETNPLAVAVIGAGASTSERQLHRFWQNSRDINLTSVEIDPEVVHVAGRFFDPPPRRVVISDGRRFIHEDTEKYDIIVIDMYAQEITIPFHVATQQFFSEIRTRLAPGGIVVTNLNSMESDSLFMKSFATTIGSVWPNLALLPIPKTCNYLLLASDRGITINQNSKENAPSATKPLLPALETMTSPAQDGILFTDDKAPTDILGLSALVASTKGKFCKDKANAS